jgi:hypothetical protein
VSLAGRLPAHLVRERGRVADLVTPKERPEREREANDNDGQLEPSHLPPLDLSPRARATLELAFTILGFLYIALVVFQYYKFATAGVPSSLCWEYGC